MSGIIDDYLRTVGDGMRLEGARKEQALRELRGHLEEKAADLQREDPSLSRAEAERRVVRDFGDPRELAAGYDAGAPLRPSGGEVAIKVGRAVGRGTRTALKWGGIALAFVLVLALVVGAWAYYEVKPIVEKNAPYPVYEHSQSCTTVSCSATPVEQRFDVYPEAREVRMDVRVSFHDVPAPGSVRVTIRDPAGNVAYDRAFGAGAGGGGDETSDHARWQTRAGTWTVTYQYTAFNGHLSVDVIGVGLPAGSL